MVEWRDALKKRLALILLDELADHRAPVDNSKDEPYAIVRQRLFRGIGACQKPKVQDSETCSMTD
jgi:hypothetical protein